MSPLNGAGTAGRSERFLLASLAVLLAGVFLVKQVETWPSRLRYPGEENSSEGMMLAEVLHLRQGVRIYDPPSPERFDAAVYGPLYYLLGARLVNPARPAYLPLRLLSLAATVGCAAACALLAFWLVQSYLAAILASFLFLSVATITHWGLSARSDLPALFFSFSGALLAYRLRKSAKLLWAVPLMLVGVFFKQQFVAGPLAVVLFLGFEKRFRLATCFAALISAGALAFVGLLQFWIFGGQSFLTHLLRYQLLPIDWRASERGYFYFVLALSIPLVLGVAFLRERRDHFLACYVGCAVFLSLSTMLREGSDTNYTFETILVLSALSGAFLADRLPKQKGASTMLLALVALLALNQYRWRGAAPLPSDFALDAGVQDYLRQHFPSRTRALSFYTGDLVRAGLDAPVSNLYHYSWLIRQGIVSDRSIRSQIDDRQYGLIVLDFELGHEPKSENLYLTNTLRSAISENYECAAILQTPGPEKDHPTSRLYMWLPVKGTSEDPVRW